MHNRIQSNLLILFLVVILAGCRTARGPLFKPAETVPADKALVYVYRPCLPTSEISDRGLPYLFVDKKRTAPMINCGYIDLFLDPGDHLFQIKKGIVGLGEDTIYEQFSLNVKTGTEYFIAFEQNVGQINPLFYIALGLSTAAKTSVVGDEYPYSVSRMFTPVPKEVAMPMLEMTHALKRRGRAGSSEERR